MRALWTGSISFGLIYIPVRLYNATRTKELKFHYLRKGDLCPVAYQRVCRTTGEEVPYEDIVRGFEYRKGNYVVLTEEDFEAANARKTKTIEILQFSNADEIDPKYYQKPYYLEPAGEAGKIYALLREALKASRKVGVSRFVLRTQERLGILRTDGDVLLLNQMMFKSEVADASDLKLPTTEQVADKELEMAVNLIGQLTSPFDFAKYEDTYTNELKKVIETKARGIIPQPKERPPRPTEVPDLMAKLRESLQQAKAKKLKEAG